MKEQSIILLVFCVVSGTLAKPPPTFLEYKDSLGQYSFGYSAPDSARSEVRRLDGSTHGSYSYVDDAGVIQSARYTADGENGFQIVATNLPRAPNPVVDTPEVAAARLDHLKALEDAAKSAKGIPEEQGQRETKIDARVTDTVAVEDSSNPTEDDTNNRVQVKSADFDANSEVKTESSAETQSKISGEEKEAVAAEKEMEMAAEDRPMQPIESQPKAAVQSDLPVLTTSFVIPDTVNLHTGIELDQSDVAAARLSSESSARPVSQPPMLQGSNLNPSMMTPSDTKTMMMSNNEKEGVSMKMAQLSGAPMPSAFINHESQAYSVPFVPRAIVPSNVIVVPYAVGSTPIYSQYNPYRYFPFGIL